MLGIALRAGLGVVVAGAMALAAYRHSKRKTDQEYNRRERERLERLMTIRKQEYDAFVSRRDREKSQVRKYGAEIRRLGAELAPVWKKKAAERKLKAEQRKREVAERKFAVEQTKREAAQERAKYHEERLKKLKQKHDSLALWWRSLAKKTEDNAREIKRHRDRL